MSCESCRIYQQEICALQERIFEVETEMGLHETLPMESSGKKSTLTSKGNGEKTATYNLKLNVSFPRLCKDTLQSVDLVISQRNVKLLVSMEDM